jgi:hypothetical protein
MTVPRLHPFVLSGKSDMWMQMSMELRWKYTDRGHNRSTGRNPCPTGTLCTVSFAWTDKGSRPAARGDRPANTAWVMTGPSTSATERLKGVFLVGSQLTTPQETPWGCPSQMLVAWGRAEPEKKMEVKFWSYSRQHIIFLTMYFKFFQMQMAVSPNTVAVKLDQELGSSKSHVGLRKFYRHISSMTKLY